MRNIIGGILLFGGVLAIAGSAGDCDGKCMEYANTIPEMLTAIGIGFVLAMVGICVLVTGEEDA